MSTYNYISIKNAVLDFYQDGGIGHEELDEPTLLKWANDAVSMFRTDRELTQRLVILQVHNGRAKLPMDFKMLGAVAGRVKATPKKSTREQIVQWVQNTYDPDCKLEINLVCNRCHKTTCECDTPFVEVRIDDVWRQAHPEAFYKGFDKIGRFGYGPGKNGYPKTDNMFHLMNYTTNPFFGLENVLDCCPNVCCDSSDDFTIKLPYIETEWKRDGEIILSYLGLTMDDEGNMMIPQDSDANEVVLQHLFYKYYGMKGRSKKDQFYTNEAEKARRIRDEHLGYFKARNIMSGAEFKSMLNESSMLKRIPLWHSDHPEGVPDLYDKYLS